LTYLVQFAPNRVGKDLLRIEPESAQEAVAEAIRKLAEDPFRANLDIKKLTGRPDYRLRVGSWRVTYLIDTARRVLTVTAVENRRDAYKR
jgi:mRNA interferase RelE/StbE